MPEKQREENRTVTHEIIGDTGHLPVRITTQRRCDSSDPRCGSSLTIPFHWHEHIEIIWMRNDTLHAVVEGEAYDLGPGDLLIINTGDIHSTRIERLPCHYMLLQISLKKLRELFPGIDGVRFRNLISAGVIEASPRLGQMLADMERLVDEAEDGYEFLFTARLCEFLYLLYKEYSVAPETAPADNALGRDRKRVAEIIAWTRRNFREPLTLEAAAGHLGISREYFCRIFRKYTGQTYLEFLCATRTMNFYNQLQTSDDPIPLLMEANGLTNYRTFLRTFREMYGTTPQKARMRIT